MLQLKKTKPEWPKLEKKEAIFGFNSLLNSYLCLIIIVGDNKDTLTIDSLFQINLFAEI